jgi:hypothetical protein
MSKPNPARVAELCRTFKRLWGSEALSKAVAELDKHTDPDKLATIRAAIERLKSEARTG